MPPAKVRSLTATVPCSSGVAHPSDVFENRARLGLMVHGRRSFLEGTAFMGVEAMKVAVVGLGYVGLPLAVEFGKKFTTIGFDLSVEKVEAYRRYVDPTGEVSTESLKAAERL